MGQSPINREGFSTIEIMLTVALFLLFVTAFTASLIHGEEGIMHAGLRLRAIHYATEGIEAARSVRDAQFSNLTDGTFGATISNGQWALAGSSNTWNPFTRQIIVSTIDARTKRIESRVSWQPSLQRAGLVSLTEQLTDWRTPTASQAELFTVDTSQAALSGDNKELRNITLTNTSTTSLTIASMTVSWINQARQIERIKIGTDTVWSRNGPGTPTGYQNSGTLLDIQDYTITTGTAVDLDNIKFNNSMTGETITIQFTMGDGSTKSVTVTPN